MSILSKIQALITAANATTGESDTTLTDAIQTLVDGYGQGGASISDGIVVKARDANGYATEIDIYVENGIVSTSLFQSGNTNSKTITHGFSKLQKINFKTPVISIGAYAFNWLNALSEIDLDFSALTTVHDYSFQGCPINVAVRVPNGASFAPNAFNDSGIISFYTEVASVGNNQCQRCKNLRIFEAPKATRFGSYTSTILSSCTSLESVLLGGVGYGITAWGTGNFSRCTQTGLTVTAYTNGSHVDGLLSNIRTGATNATIIIKASEQTEYNGVTYAAGDTILTSEVTV